MPKKPMNAKYRTKIIERTQLMINAIIAKQNFPNIARTAVLMDVESASIFAWKAGLFIPSTRHQGRLDDLYKEITGQNPPPMPQIPAQKK